MARSVCLERAKHNSIPSAGTLTDMTDGVLKTEEAPCPSTVNTITFTSFRHVLLCLTSV